MCFITPDSLKKTTHLYGIRGKIVVLLEFGKLLLFIRTMLINISYNTLHRYRVVKFYH